MFLAHKIELRPTDEQIIYLDKACGCRRHCYNELLSYFSNNKWSKQLAYDYYINVMRKKYQWYTEVSSRVTRNVIDDMDKAFKHFFRRVKLNQNPGFPKFKKKNINDSFALRERNKFDINGRFLKIEKLKTKIKMRQKLRFSGIPKQVTISKRAGKYFASILVEVTNYNKKNIERKKSVGVDFGIKNLAVLSDGTEIPPNRPLKRNLKKLIKKQKNLSRKRKGSNRYVRAKQSIAKLYYRICNERHAVLHELSDYITSRYDMITIEDLDIIDMLKNRKFARAISDVGFGYLKSYIMYKGELRNCNVVIADRYFPSTKRCSSCGKLHNMPISKRKMECDCGLIIDRDLNAAINLDKYGADTLQPTKKRT